MKRFITMIVSALAFLAAWAQQPMVTLSHDGELTFFTNLTAFESALDAAENGDTLYLSEGNFYITGGAVTINKRVSVVGTGYGSHLLGSLTLENKNVDLEAPIFDGVRIEKLGFSNVTSSSRPVVSEIRRCWITQLNSAGDAGEEVKIESCLIEMASFGSHYTHNLELRNSKIINATEFHECSVVLNCNIGTADCYPEALISSIIDNSSTNRYYSSSRYRIINSLLTNTSPYDNVITDNCYIAEEGTELFDENMDCTIDLAEKGYLGNDGTIVGAYGGDTPFSKNPSVPTVDQEKSSVEYDAENNKLKVTITVAEN